MDQVSKLVQGYSSTFEQCLLAKDPVAHAKSLPDTVQKKLLLFLLEPHSDKYKEELKTKYNIRGELLESIDKWKIHSKITKAQNPEEIKYLIENFMKTNRNSFNYPKPAEFQSGADESKAEEYTLPSKLKPIKSLEEWVKQQLDRNEDIITTLTKKAIRAVKQERLLKLKVVNKERLLSMPGLLVQYPDGFVIQFIKTFYEQMLKVNKNYEIPNFIYYNISKFQFMHLKDAIPGIINKDQYLRVWFSHNYDEELQKFQKGELTISEKDQKRVVLLKILKDLQSLKTARTKSMQRNILREILQLDISRDQADKKLFLQYLKDNPVSSSYQKQKVREQKYQKYHAKASYAMEDMDINLGLQSSSTGQDQIIKETIQRLFKKTDAEATLKQLEEYFQTSKLNKIYATVKLSEGGKIDDYQNYLSVSELKQLREERQITILQTNKRKWKAEEQVQLKVRVKNINDIHVQVYRIDLERHFVEKNAEIDQTQSLSYLQPNHSYHYSTQNKNPYLVQIYDIKIEGIPASRGVWIVQLEGEGISSRAYIRKGAIVNINSTNTAGTELKYYDQNGTQITDFHIWMDGKKHAVKSSFTVPYGETDKSLSLIVIKDGYAQRFQVYVPRESYALDIAYLYNTESFIVGSIAKVLLHPQLMLNFDRNMQVSFKLLEKVKILVTLTNNLGIKSTIDFDNVQFKSTEDYLLQFPIQSYTKSIDISVSAKVKKYNKKDEDLTSAHSIQIQLSENNMNFIDLYMRKNKDQYCVFVLGKNGEPIPRTEVIIQYNAEGRYNEDSQNLMTTKEGCVFVGDLKGISKLSARVNLKSGAILRSWNLQKFQSQVDLVQNTIYKQGEQIVFPLTNKQKIQLWKVSNSGVYTENFTDKITFGQFSITIKGLPLGRYDLDFIQSDKKTSFTVVKGKIWESENKIYDENIGQLYQIDPEQNHHLSLGEAKFTKQGENLTVQIPVRGTYDIKKDNTLRAHLMVSNFMVPNFRGKFDLNNLRGSRQVKYQSFATKESQFYNNKKLSEETSYVINRGKQKKYIGNNLQKPKIFLKRIQVRDTTQLDEVLQSQGAYQQKQSMARMSDRAFLAEKCAPYGARYGGKVHGSLSSLQPFVGPEDLTTHNNFLSLPGTIVSNQKGNSLVFKVPEGYSHFECFLFSKLTAIVRKFELPVEDVQKKSLSHLGIQQSAKDTAWTMSREVYKARKGQSIKVGRDSVWSAIGLSNVAGFAKIKGAKLQDWVTNWNTYSDEQKLTVYDEKVCHQLNTYIKYNDKTFFENIVLPFIKNKVTKTFVDLCLLENEQAHSWTSLDKFQTLNEFEKVLLVHQLVKAGRKEEAKSIVNAMENINKSERVTFQQFKQQFDTVITAKLTEQAQKAPKSKSQAPRSMMSKKKAARKQEPQMRMMAMQMDMMQCKAMEECQQIACEEDDAFGDYDDRSRFVQPFKQMEKTKQYTETTYSGMKYPHQSQNLIKSSPFWTSVAQHFLQGNGDFLSQNFMYLSLAVEFTLASCFIPNQKLLQYGLKNQEDAVLIQPSSSFLVFVREVKSLPFEKKFGVLLNQRFFNPDDRFYYEEDGTKIEKQAEQFIARKPYCVQTLITNTSGTRLELQLLIDIPEGSVPLQSHETTQIQSINLEPYSTLSFERYFYFPSVGSYTIYPANACRSGLVIAKADQIKKIDVLEVQTIKKMDTLQNVLKSGQKQGILQYLQTKNIFDGKIFDPASILWMLKQKQFYLKVIDVLRSRKFYLSEIWMFGYFHNDLKAISQFEKTQNIQNPENVLRNLSIFEYFPYYSSRAHKFLNQNKSTIRNEQFKKTYFCFLFASLFNEPTSSRSRVAFIYYLLLQDRIDQAFNVLSQIEEKDKTNHQLQFDYIECFIDMYKGYPSFTKSRKIAEKYVNYPVASWQKMFKEIVDTLKEYDSEQIVEEKKKVQFTTTVVNEGHQLRISVPPETTVEVYLYDINLELYFSTFPFTEVQTFSANTVPNTVQVFEAGESRQEKFSRKVDMKDCFVEVYSSISGLKKKKISSFLWSNPDIKIKVKQESGYAQVFYKNKKQAGCYCKVYQMKNGQSKFYRDGYTDITGTFKYALSDLEGISQFSVLFVTDNGGVVERVKPPSQQGFLA